MGKKPKVFVSPLKIQYADMGKRYIRFPDGVIRRLTAGTPEQFDQLAVSILRHPKSITELLAGIDRQRWDKVERWWFIEDNLRRNRLSVYLSPEEAEEAEAKRNVA